MNKKDFVNKWKYRTVNNGEIYDCEKELIADLQLLEKDIAFKAWKAAANAFRLYPNNKHTFSDYWSVEEKDE